MITYLHCRDQITNKGAGGELSTHRPGGGVGHLHIFFWVGGEEIITYIALHSGRWSGR